MTKYTVPALLAESIASYPDLPAMGYAGEPVMSYKDLGEKIDQVCGLLDSYGLEKGDKAALFSVNMPNWGVIFFALLKKGIVAVPVLPDFHANEVKSIMLHAEVKLIFISENLFPKIENILFPDVRGIVLTNNLAIIPEGTRAEQLTDLKPYIPREDYLSAPVDVEEDDLASIIYTSGTTGNSKGVMLSHRNIAWNGKQAFTMENVFTYDRFLSILPLSHTYENTLGLLLPLFHGASVYYLRKPPVPAVLLPALQLVRPTKVLSVPLVIEKIFKNKIYPQFQKSPVTRTLYKFSLTRKLLHRIAGMKLMKTFGGKINFFGIGGSKVDATVERFLKESGFPYAIGYGLTETSPLLAGSNPARQKLGFTGPSLQGVKLRLADIDKASGEGEIQAKGPNIMQGYYKNPEATAQVFTADGWFRTGDLGSFDKQGHLKIKGRIKNMILGASGENIYPEEIESVINRMKYVVESLVVEKKGKLVALIHLNMEEIEHQYQSLKNDATVYAEKIGHRKDEILKEIKEKVNAQVNKFSKLQQVSHQEDPFEKTPTQKIKRFLYHQKN
ncbi:MAG TPA: AMP-binding protein [Prolixibacteraceae bacterium]|nr:AMP-binding protein [Prolixibacteraceae bacterium]